MSEEEGSTSLFAWALGLSDVQLSKYNIEDLGVGLPTDSNQVHRFRLSAYMRRELTTLCADLQRISDGVVQHLSKAVFTQSPVDPGGHLLRACHGTRDLNLLSINLRELAIRIRRVAIRIHNLQSYDGIHIDSLSSIQTTTSWNDSLEAKRDKLSPTRVARTYISHPRYQALYNEDARRNINAWVDNVTKVGPGGPWPPLESERAARTELLAAFPFRHPEENPQRMACSFGAAQATYSNYARSSSYSKGPGWTLNDRPVSSRKSLNSDARAENEGASVSPACVYKEEEVTRLLDQTSEQSISERQRFHPHAAMSSIGLANRPSLTSGLLATHISPALGGASASSYAAARIAAPASVMANAGARGRSAAPAGGNSGGSNSSSNGRRAPCGPPRGPPLGGPGPPGLPPAVPPPSGVLPMPPWDWDHLAAPPPPGGGGGSGPPGGGNGNGPDPSGPGQQGATIDPFQLRLNTKVNTRDLPKWDGAYHSAIDWICDVQRYADMSETVASQLGHYLPGALESKSSAQRFYDSVSAEWKSFMRSSYARFVWTMKEYFLTERWVLEMTHYADRQSFRQRGFKAEDPLAFLSRRLRYIRVLGLADEGSAREITELLRTAPPAWRSVLNLANLTSLLQTAALQGEQLVELARAGQRGLSGASDGDLVKRLTGLGFTRAANPSRSFVLRHGSVSRGARLAVTASDGVDGVGQAFITEVDDGEEEPNPEEGGGAAESYSVDSALKEAYAAIAKSKPVGKPSYAKRDDVRTTTNQLPPSPCRHCGSPMHWNRECPHADVNTAKMKAAENLAEIDDDLYD
jgi:hypothetical protein